MAEYRQLVDFSNAFTVAIVQSMAELSLGVPLIWSQMSKAFEKSAKGLLKDAGVTITGRDIPSIANSFANAIKSVGLCQRVNLLEVSDSKLVIDIGECVLSPATKILAAKYPTLTPPCPMLAILAGAIQSATGKTSRIDGCVLKLEENTRIFTIKLD